MYKKINKGLCAAILPLLLVFSLPGCTGGEKDAHSGKEVQKTCFVTISCATVLDNTDKLNEEKKNLIPEDGFILHKSEEKFNEGESVSDILKRATREKKIHLETSTFPGMDAEYIKGVGNLYASDCGPESGWMYRINDVFKSEGIGSIAVNENDNIEILYTCDLGRDIGNEWTE